MKQLIPMDDFGVFCDNKDMARANSLMVAKMFEKRHDHILRDIEKITAPKSGLSEEFRQHNFVQSSYKDSTVRKLPCYDMTRDGFTLLVMGFTGSKAMQFKEAYIKRFNKMEKYIKTLVEARTQFPLLTEQIKLIHEKPMPYHFSNECDMLNRIVLGKTAKQVRQELGLDKKESIRPYLTQEQIELLDKLQKIDIGLLIAVPNFEQRKRHLEWYVMKSNAIKSIDEQAC